MKKLFLILSLAIAANGMAQVKGDNTILVSGVTFKQVVNALLDEGFKIEKIDSNYNTVRTEWKEHVKYSFNYYFDIRVKDSTASITGQSKSSNFLFEIQYGKTV